MTPEDNGDGGYSVEFVGRTAITSIPRSVFRDSRLTFGAKGLFAFLWDLPTGWRIRSTHLSSVGPQGKDAIRRLLAELERFAALRVEKIRGERGRLNGKKWLIYNPEFWAEEAPLAKSKQIKPTPEAVFAEGWITRQSDNPTIEKPAAKGLPSSSFSSSTPRKNFDLRESGIVTWNGVDTAAAKKIEARADPVDLAIAVSTIQKRDQEALPGRVLRELAAQHRRKKIVEKGKKAVEQKPEKTKIPAKCVADLQEFKKQNKELHHA